MQNGSRKAAVGHHGGHARAHPRAASPYARRTAGAATVPPRRHGRWRETRWAVLALLWVLTVALGYAGFAAQPKPPGETWTVLGTLYATLQLFTLESGAALGNGTINAALECARWMAPLVAAFTAAEAAAAIFYDQAQLLRARAFRGHVVICGLGEKGLLLTKAFRERGRPVFVIEQDEDNDLIQSCRAHGAVVYVGDARQPEALERARAADAACLIAVCGDDGANAEVATTARRLAAARWGQGGRRRLAAPLNCIAHVVDPHLWHLLRRWEIGGGADGFRLQFFNVYDAGARAVLSAHPPFPEGDTGETHVVVVGGGELARSVVLHAVRRWRERAEGEAGVSSPRARLCVTLVAKDARAAMDWLRLRHPGLETWCHLCPVELDLSSPRFHRGEFGPAGGGDTLEPAYIAYVCLPDDAECLTAALALTRAGLLARGRPAVACLAREAGLAGLLRVWERGHGPSHNEERPTSWAGDDGLRAFSLLEHTCEPELVLGGAAEVLARALHEHYRAQHGLSDGAAAPDDPSLLPWEELSEEKRESNRAEADHIRVKLRAVGCGIAPLHDWEAGGFPFTPDEVEAMARMEHERWLSERLAHGWRPGPRDEARRTNPHLVPWEELDEESRAYNRAAVRLIPGLLLRAGLQVHRWTAAEPPPPEETEELVATVAFPK